MAIGHRGTIAPLISPGSWISLSKTEGDPMGCQFEPAIQWDCVREVVRLLKETSASPERAIAIGQHACCFIGSGLTLMEPDKPIGAAGTEIDTVELTDFELAGLLETELPAEGTAAINWDAILQIILPILLELLRRR